MKSTKFYLLYKVNIEDVLTHSRRAGPRPSPRPSHLPPLLHPPIYVGAEGPQQHVALSWQLLVFNWQWSIIFEKGVTKKQINFALAKLILDKTTAFLKARQPTTVGIMP